MVNKKIKFLGVQFEIPENSKVIGVMTESEKDYQLHLKLKDKRK